MSELIQLFKMKRGEKVYLRRVKLLKAVIKLYCNGKIDLDPTYGSGCFYKKIPGPGLKFDLNPRRPGIDAADCRHLPLPDASQSSIMFDPPFVVGRGNLKAGIMKNRYGSFRSIAELWRFYNDSIKEFYRLLKPNGVLIFKCQDTVQDHNQYFSHMKIIIQAFKAGFYGKDLLILTVKHRPIRKNTKTIQHARKFHSYFLVFIKKKSKIRYDDEV